MSFQSSENESRQDGRQFHLAPTYIPEALKTEMKLVFESEKHVAQYESIWNCVSFLPNE